eukprot:scaffold8396_cov127-Isochrysis_galbana.AAC.6
MHTLSPSFLGSPNASSVSWASFSCETLLSSSTTVSMRGTRCFVKSSAEKTAARFTEACAKKAYAHEVVAMPAVQAGKQCARVAHRLRRRAVEREYLLIKVLDRQHLSQRLAQLNLLQPLGRVQCCPPQGREFAEGLFLQEACDDGASVGTLDGLDEGVIVGLIFVRLVLDVYVKGQRRVLSGLEWSEQRTFLRVGQDMNRTAADNNDCIRELDAQKPDLQSS